MKRILSALSLIVLISMMLIVSIPPAKAQFVLASWDYPDEYGQGIDEVYVAHNKSGSFVDFSGSPYSAGDNTTIGLSTGGGYHLRFTIYVQLNRTRISLSKPWNDGHLFIRLAVTVTAGSTLIFSQQNLTYLAFGGTADPVEWYKYSVIPDFIPLDGTFYTVVLSYEIYY